MALLQSSVEEKVLNFGLVTEKSVFNDGLKPTVIDQSPLCSQPPVIPVSSNSRFFGRALLQVSSNLTKKQPILSRCIQSWRFMLFSIINAIIAKLKNDSFYFHYLCKYFHSVFLILISLTSFVLICCAAFLDLFLASLMVKGISEHLLQYVCVLSTA